MKIITDATCTSYHTPGHPERPERILNTLEKLRAQTELGIDWLEPEPANDKVILRAHSPEHLARLRVPFDFDADTSYFPEIEMLARKAAGAGLRALESARRNETVFSLMRPPGHHATRDQVMGFCYLSNMAITVLQAVASGSTRVAVFDFDVHHGNGTEDILANHPHAAFFSIHEYPCYPGTGKANVGNNCFNYPVAPFSPRDDYRKTLSKALEDLRTYQPELIGVSAGFDAYSGDPLAQGSLELEDYHWLGRELREFGVPMFSLLEGGYSDDLPQLIFAYLKGINGK
ncbi:MAG TPA: histone deacetylase [Verrucomicrobiae bacterium]|nr:histone deacetylase [Verrucomicrobiae bacterium]